MNSILNKLKHLLNPNSYTFFKYTNLNENQIYKKINYSNKNYNLNPRQPRLKYIVIFSFILVVLHIINRIITDNVFITIFIAYFLLLLIITLILSLSQKCIITKDKIIIKNLFFKAEYYLKDVIKLYLAKLPTDQRIIKRASWFNEIISSINRAQGRNLPAYNTTDINNLARIQGPNRLWLDIKQNNNIISLELGEIKYNKNKSKLINSRPTFIKQLLIILPKQKIDRRVQSIFR